MAASGKGGAAREAFQKYLKLDPNGTYAERAKQKMGEL
jgi:TolA-binding protein